MTEDIKDCKNSEINLNLNLPPEDTEGGISLKNIILTVYNARKIFLICICVSILAGLVTAAGLLMLRRREAAAIIAAIPPPPPPTAAPAETSPPVSEHSMVSLAIVFNYSKPDEHIFPDGKAFDTEFFYSAQIWENALKTIEREDLSIVDVMREVNIVNAGYADTMSEMADVLIGLPENIPETLRPAIVNNYLALYSTAANINRNNTYLLTIPVNSSLFNNTEEISGFLLALSDGYTGFLVSEYYNDDNIGKLNKQYLQNLINLTDKTIIWDAFDYSVNFNLIRGRFEALKNIVLSMNSADPFYVSASGKKFADYAEEIRDIINTDLQQWITRADNGLYVRNIDRFKNEYRTIIDIKTVEYQYYTQLLDSYNETLNAYSQSQPDAAGQSQRNNQNILSGDIAETAAGLQKQISMMELQYSALQSNESTLRNRSMEMEEALTGFIASLFDYQDMLHDVIFTYYEQRLGSDAENAVLVSTPAVISQYDPNAAAAPAAAPSPAPEPAPEIPEPAITRAYIIIAFAACVVLGVAAAFLAATVKKYLPEKNKGTEEQ